MVRVRRRIPKLPLHPSMDPAEREYMRRLMQYQRAFNMLLQTGLDEILHPLKQQAAKELPPELRTDSLEDAWKLSRLFGKAAIRMDANIERDVRKLIRGVQTRMLELFPNKLLRKWSEMMVAHVNEFSKNHTVRVGKAVDLDIEPLMKDGELSPYFRNVVDENVGLIKSIPEKRLPALKNALVNGITNDMPHDKIAKLIDKYTQGNAGNARLIARDQVNKLNGKLNQYRQQKLGGTRYKWRTSKDEKVRKDHKALSGKTFSWDAPPITNKATGARNHPGGDFQCRCTAEMIIGDVLKER